jgi:hypothetical protein
VFVLPLPDRWTFCPRFDVGVRDPVHIAEP